MIKEWLARGIIIIGMAVLVSVPILNTFQQGHVTLVHARMAESGGWMPENLNAVVGEPLHLRLTSDDVTHGFAVGQLDQPHIEIKPCEVTAVTLVFTNPGKYTFYCTRWCGVNHWRMRGTIEVTGSQTIPNPVQPPLYVRLGLDIDAAHTASVTPARIPSAWGGALLAQTIPPAYRNREYYLSHTPLDLWLALRSEPSSEHLTDQDIWDLVAWLWQSNTTPEQLATGKQLYTANCAACHGENGGGDGVYAAQLAASSHQTTSDVTVGKHTQQPANFTDPVTMLSANPAHLQGKILRGGMGTGMPSWGAIFTEDQTWALVAYLWSFQFQMEVNP